jgi:hypothetical protein
VSNGLVYPKIKFTEKNKKTTLGGCKNENEVVE